MLQRGTVVKITDGSGVRSIRVFHVYGGSWQRYAKPSFFVKGAVQEIRAYPRRIHGKRYRPIRYGYRVRGLVPVSVLPINLFDSSRIFVHRNRVALLKRRGILRSKYVFGPVSRRVRRKQFLTFFEKLI